MFDMGKPLTPPFPSRCPTCHPAHFPTCHPTHHPTHCPTQPSWWQPPSLTSTFDTGKALTQSCPSPPLHPHPPPPPPPPSPPLWPHLTATFAPVDSCEPMTKC